MLFRITATMWRRSSFDSVCLSVCLRVRIISRREDIRIKSRNRPNKPNDTTSSERMAVYRRRGN